MVGVVGANSPTTLMYLKGLLPLPLLAADLAALAATAARCALGAHVRRIVGLLAGVRGHRVAYRLADQRPRFGQRQLAETLGRNDLARLAHDFELVAQEVATESHFDQTLVADTVDRRADFGHGGLGDRPDPLRLLAEDPLSGFQLLADRIGNHGDLGVDDGGIETLFESDLVHARNRHGMSFSL